ncbi:hypothetical protein Kpol_543p25 [Vanderwaltozyma polyspora DSM 70294]|uniref:NAD-dependent epimerase/dehydratase domain-containing protein n=1 Tax=Vanderwaltozyma polyspora (strain ATCC 22028 / DSM 70294 / BCRC 21397 / CBS 2163 / NBRC 10782 / NRRL Y-8283 / UCD 57-17) TaxID=436907 RepID=A7THN0_VANPO|nr:uncharacterized protein Kpol_543p25 [Vanderwaltozyma polyspora DSM 70294]EDO18196.1 hypothetical protein Kpol_543p25 [Vanderwaltozyma polyspora DSM 70294]
MYNKLLVFGGNGFLGKRICQEAVTRGFQVTSVSRSGIAPEAPTPSDSHWIREVKWESCDIFKPDSYYHLLSENPNIVHSVGILFENDIYKKIIRGSFSEFLKYLQNHKPSLDKNPLIDRDPNMTYEMVNKKSALILADAFSEILQKQHSGRLLNEKASPTFTYISADRGFPLVPDAYINSKRDTESELKNYNDVFRSIIMRPGFMYDEYSNNADPSYLIRRGIEAMNCANHVVFNNKFDFINNQVRPAVSAQQVSKSVMDHIVDKNYNGVVSLEEITKN